MTSIAVFPGQGAQTVGMGRAFAEAEPAAASVFALVDEALGEPLSTLAFSGPIETLTLTRNAQPALMATSLAAVRAFEARAGAALTDCVDYVAGHSLGEYSALAAAGSLDLADAARLLRLRGDAMQRAVPAGEGAMAAILGLEVEQVAAIAGEAAAVGVCELANDNSDGQAVLSGARPAILRAIEIAKEKGAKRAMLLEVSAPFHCSLMTPAAAELAPALDGTRFAVPGVPLVANVTAQPVEDPAAFPDLLARQVTGRVRWRETMAWMAMSGIDLVVEFGSGKVLGGLARRALPNARILSVQTPDDVPAALDALGRN